MWLAEAEIYSVEVTRQAEGAPPRDLSGYSAWRDSARQENLDLIDLYKDYSPGMTDGMSGSLNVAAVKTVLDVEGVPVQYWPRLIKRLLRLHSLITRCLKARKGSS